MRWACNCGSRNCAPVDVDLIEACLVARFEWDKSNSAGSQLYSRFLSARRFDPNTASMRMDMTAECPIFKNSGQVACPEKLRRLFAVKGNMWTEIKRCVTAEVAPERLWLRENLKPPRDKFKMMEARAWFRRHAQLFGDTMPTTGNIHMDPQTVEMLHTLYAYETRTKVSYSYFAQAISEESAEVPTIHFRKRKEVSSPCHDCINLRRRLAEAIADGNPQLVQQRRRDLEGHFADIRKEKMAFSRVFAQSNQQGASTVMIHIDFMDQHSTQVRGCTRH
jgi:hypothetical protein